MNPTRLPRLLRTLRHLKASQLFWRARYMLERRMGAPAIVAPTMKLTKERKQRKTPGRPRSGRRLPGLRLRTGLRAGWLSATPITLVWRGGW